MIYDKSILLFRFLFPVLFSIILILLPYAGNSGQTQSTKAKISLQTQWEDQYGEIPLPFLVTEASHHPKASIDYDDLEGSGLFSAPYYYPSMRKALKKVKATLGRPLSAELMVEIHSAFARIGRKERGEKIPEGFAEVAVVNGFIRGNLTIEGLTEYQDNINDCSFLHNVYFTNTRLLRRAEKSKQPLKLISETLEGIDDFYSRKMVVGRKSMKKQIHVKELNQLLRNYYREIKKDKNDEERLRTIVRYLQLILRRHDFRDGNGRLVLMLLLKKLLIENKLPPSIPDIADITGLSVKQAVSAIKRGQKIFAARHDQWKARGRKEKILGPFDTVIKNRPPFMAALDAHEFKAAKQLLKDEVKGSELGKYLVEKVREDQVEAIQLLLDYGANVNQEFVDGWETSNAFREAMYNKNYELGELLIRRGASNTKNDEEMQVKMKNMFNSMELYGDKSDRDWDRKYQLWKQYLGESPADSARNKASQ